jgi:hypothetical protein
MENVIDEAVHSPEENAEFLALAMECMFTPDELFEQWAHSLPPSHWAKHDIGACRLGWEIAKLLQPGVPGM